jgi:hypothetical protein
LPRIEPETLVTNKQRKSGLRTFFAVYQFVVPLALFPLAYWLWWRRLDEDHAVTALILFVPVVFYQLFVMIGVIRLRMWRMNTWPTIRGLRPHHGFVLGTASALLIYVATRMTPVGTGGLAAFLTSAFLGASVFGFWNWWYETYAIKSGFISIFTRRVAQGASAEEAVTDYAPVLFGSMGACYGIMVRAAEVLLTSEHSDFTYWSVAVIGGLAMILVPTGLYEILHRRRYGETGLRSYKDVIERR